MLSDRMKRNIWLTFSILSLVIILDRTIRVADGSVEWWNLVCAIIIAFFCTRNYLCYRRKVKGENR